MTNEDSVDRGLSAWMAELPDVDPHIEAARQRLLRLGRQLERTLAETAGHHGLTLGDWEALSVLRRSGTPYELSPTALAAELEITSGTISVRLDRLQRAGLITRSRSTADARARTVQLTRSGHQAWSAATKERTDREHLLLTAALEPHELHTLNQLVRKVALAIEHERGPAPRRGPTPE